MAISFVNKGTWGSGSSAISPGLPASMQSGDLCLLFVESANEIISISSAGSVTTWTRVTNSPVSTGTAATARGVRLEVYYGWWTSGIAGPIIADSGNHTTGIIMAFRGVDPTTPFDAVSPVATVDSGATTTLTPPGITTQTANALVVYAMGLDADATTATPGAITGTPTNSNLTSLTVRHAQTTSTNTGGGIGVITGFKASAGASGNITGATKPSSATAYLTMSLREKSSFNITVTVPTTTTHTISEVSGTTILATTTINIIVPSSSNIAINNNNPTIESTSLLMTINSTSQLQIANEFIEGSETSLSPLGILTMIEFIEGTIVDFNMNGVLTAYEFIEGGI